MISQGRWILVKCVHKAGTKKKRSKKGEKEKNNAMRQKLDTKYKLHEKKVS